MKVLIIEDEHPAVQRLKRLLNDLNPHMEVLDILGSVEDTINWFGNNPAPDIVFMDIQLEDGICFEIFEKVEIRTPIIFTTAFDKYAIDAFKVNSVDYLLKPVELSSLDKALKKYEHMHFDVLDKGLQQLIQKINPPVKARFLVKVGERYKSVQVNDINFFYIKERCNFLGTYQGKHYAVDYSLDKIEKLVDPERFFRVNRNFIVNFSAIKDIIAFSSSRLKLLVDKYEEEVLVSRERVTDFKNWMDR